LVLDPQVQQREREADEDLAAGRVTRYEGDEQFLAALDERTKPLDRDWDRLTSQQSSDPSAQAIAQFVADLSRGGQVFHPASASTGSKAIPGLYTPVPTARLAVDPPVDPSAGEVFAGTGSADLQGHVDLIHGSVPLSPRNSVCLVGGFLLISANR
jgi:hypothetical protein